MFETTRWSLVLAARQPEDHAREALAQLCQAYRAPVLGFVRRQPRFREQAEDLTQAFFLHLLETGGHAGAERSRGRFRSYLLGALRHYLSHVAAAAAADKRGGGREPVALDAPGVAEPADGDDPEQAFERDFARIVLERAVRRLRQEAHDAGKDALLDAASPFLLEAPEPSEYEAAAARLGLRRNTFAVAVHRMRERLQLLVRSELADTVSAPGELEAEAQRLAHTLGEAGQRAS